MMTTFKIKTNATVPCELRIQKIISHFLVIFSIKYESEYINFKIYAPTHEELESELEIFKECYNLDIDIATILKDFSI